MKTATEMLKNKEARKQLEGNPVHFSTVTVDHTDYLHIDLQVLTPVLFLRFEGATWIPH